MGCVGLLLALAVSAQPLSHSPAVTLAAPPPPSASRIPGPRAFIEDTLTLIANISQKSVGLQFAFFLRCLSFVLPPLTLISKAAGRKSAGAARSRCVALFVWIHV